MVDLHTIISEAGAEGISLSKLSDKSKLKDSALQDELKHLRSEFLIAGPFKYARTQMFYTKGYEPSGETVGRLVDALSRNVGNKLATISQLEKKVKQPFKSFFKDGVRLLIATGRAVELKAGPRTYLFHVDAARQLFPNLASGHIEDRADEKSASFKEQVLEAYRVLKNEQNGLSAVSIGKLLQRLGCSKQALHLFLLEEARHGNADLHPTTVTDINPEDHSGLLHVPGKSEPAVTVTFRE